MHDYMTTLLNEVSTFGLKQKLQNSVHKRNMPLSSGSHIKYLLVESLTQNFEVTEAKDVGFLFIDRVPIALP